MPLTYDKIAQLPIHSFCFIIESQNIHVSLVTEQDTVF